MPEESSFPIMDQLMVLRRRRWAIFITASTIALSVVLKTVLTPPTYRATTELQVEREEPRILPFKNILSGGSQFDDFYQTQYQLIQSRNVARRVLVMLGDIPAPPLRTVSTLSGGWPMAPASPAAEETSAEAKAVERLLKSLRVEPIRNSRLVKIHALATDPKRAALVANGVADAYIAFLTDEKFSTTERASTGLSHQIDALNQESVRREHDLQSYAVNNDIVALSDKRNATQQRFDDLNVEYTKALAERIDAEARWRSAKSAPPESIREVGSSELIKDMKNTAARLEGEYQQLSRMFKPGWPALERKRAEMESAKGKLAHEIDTIASRYLAAAEKDYRAALDHEQALSEELSRQKTEIQELNLKKIRYDTLKSELDSKRKILEDLVTSQNETGVARQVEGTAGGNVRIVDRAEVPKERFRPIVSLNLTLGLLSGLFLGVFVAFVIESLDNSVKTADDVQAILDRPTLGIVPLVSRRDDEETTGADPGPTPISTIETAARDPRSSAAESYRDLRTGILLSSAGAAPRVLLVTSSRPGEGKTATAVNLAVALSQLDRKVLLIDCDLRRPRIHKVLGISRESGLSNYLSSSDISLSSIVSPTEVVNLHVVLSGPVPPNAAELLASDRFDQLLAEATGGRLPFDHVILDSSPLLSVADPVILASRADGAILVVFSGSTPKGDLLRAKQKLLQSKVHLLGAVLNKVDTTSDGYYAYGERYGKYRYEYEGVDGVRARRRHKSARKSKTA